MPKAPRYIATAPNGQTFTRNSDRTYTHAVIARNALVYTPLTRSWTPTDDDTFFAMGFCGRRDLADKLAGDCRSRREFRDVLVVPVTDTRA